MCCGAGVSPAFLRRVEMRKIAGETPAPQKSAFLAESLAYVPQVTVILRKKVLRN